MKLYFICNHNVTWPNQLAYPKSDQMFRKILLLSILFCLASQLPAQKMNWRKHLKLADEFFKKSQYADAALHYKAAWLEKNNKFNLIHKAGECYYIIKDYANAADAFSHVKDRRKNFPLAEYKYAMALKQSGRYEAAKREFATFKENYKGPEKNNYQKAAQAEIQGCELALQLEETEGEVPSLEIEHLSSSINSNETEFAPIPITDKLLYFSSTMNARAQIYASTKEGEQWSKAVLPPNFPQIENEHFCNGTLSPDGKRFYFTICKSTETWGGLTTRCEINVIKKAGSSWSAPEPLSEYINLPNATATHPFVIYNGNTEILYFSSNRPGGQGGMDLWFITRDISDSGIDFSFPTNCGKTINTAGDEITPFYDLDNATLYFASNGHINIGGYDIFNSMGSKTQWEAPKHLGKPINSSADDYFFVLAPGGGTGFLVSNRIAEPRKPTTVHEDIFSFVPAGVNTQKYIVSGRIYDKYTGGILPDVTVAIFEINPDQSKTLKNYQAFPAGSYQFELEANKQYEIEAQKEGYRRSGFEFNTLNPSATEGIGRAILLEDLSYQPDEPGTPDPTPIDPVTPPVDPTPVDPTPVDPTPTPPTPDPTPTPPVSEPGEPYTIRSKAKNDKSEYITSAPKHQGIYYKIQIAAVSKYKEGDGRFSKVERLGRIDTEYLIARKLTRVLIADFFTLGEARAALKKAKNSGFGSAFLVKYENGYRMGKPSN